MRKCKWPPPFSRSHFLYLRIQISLKPQYPVLSGIQPNAIAVHWPDWPPSKARKALCRKLQIRCVPLYHESPPLTGGTSSGMPDVQEALSFMVVRRKKVYCIIPDISTTQIVPFESLKSLNPRPSSGFLAEVEEEEAL